MSRVYRDFKGTAIGHISLLSVEDTQFLIEIDCSHFQIQLRQHNYVADTIVLDLLQIIITMIGHIYLAPIHSVLAGGNVKDGCEQIERGVMFIVAELPHLHCIQMLYFPWSLPHDIQCSGETNAIHEHSPADIGIVKLFAVVGTQL